MSSADVLALVQRTLLGEAIDYLDGVAIFVWDEDRNYIAVNDAACRLVGLERDQLLRMRVGDMTEDRAAPYFEQVQQAAVHTGSHTIDGGSGPVQVRWVTCHTRVAGLPYLVSVCWRA